MSKHQFKQNIAVIIGINNYENGIPALGTAKEDAEAIAEILAENYHYKIHSIINNQATKKQLEQLLNIDLPNLIKTPSSRLIFYFAGHGIALNGDEGPQGYLIPQDGKLGDVSTYLPMQTVETALSKLSCRHCFVILDCCFAGAFRWSSTRRFIHIPKTIHKERYDRFIQDAAWQVITSAGYDQTALDNLDLKNDRGTAKNQTSHSPFATALMEALQGKGDIYPPAKHGKPAGDGIITATELYLYLRDSVEIPTDAIKQRQTPQIWSLNKHDKGEFIFLIPNHPLNLPSAPSLDDLEENNPYRGLKSYEKKHSNLFFGRNALIGQLYEFMSHPDRPLTVVLGASGSGKSSLVKAGLIPYLDKFHQWKTLTPIRPGESPLTRLNSLIKELDNDSKTLHQAIANWSKNYPNQQLLLVIDQLEELITLCRDETEKEQFLHILANLATTYDNQVKIVVTLRSDFESQFSNTPLQNPYSLVKKSRTPNSELRTPNSGWQEGRFIVPAMTRNDLREVIEEPASAKVVYFESLEDRGYLVDRLIDEVADMPGALPLLSFALSELYLKLAHRYLEGEKTGDTVDRIITWRDYDELGGVIKSLTRRADEEYDALVKEDAGYETTIRHVMLRMVAIGGELARRRVYQKELVYPEPEYGRVKTFIKRFDGVRLLISDQDENGEYVEPAHDALVTGWEKLLTWKKEEEETLILQRRLTPAAMDWDQVKDSYQTRFQDKATPLINAIDRGFLLVENLLFKLPGYLIRRLQSSQEEQRRLPTQFLWNSNPYLDVLDQENQENNNWLNQIEREFVQASILQKRRNGSWRLRIAITIILGLSGLTAFAFIQQNLANDRARIALARQLAAQSQVIKDQQVNLLPRSVLLAVEAMKRFPSLETDQALRSSLVLLPKPSMVNIPHPGSVTHVAFSPDGNYLATASYEDEANSNRQTVRLWEIDSQKELFRIDHQNSVSDIAFSADGQYLATASDDKTAQIWDVPSRQEVFSVEGKDDMEYIVFHPSGTSLATGNEDGTVQIWNLKNKQAVFTFKHEDSVNSVTFSPDGQYLASASGDTTARIWDVATKQEIFRFKHGDIVSDIVFSPDGKYLATASSDQTIKIWEVNSGKEIKLIKYSGSEVTIAFSPNSQYLVSHSVTGGGALATYDSVTRILEIPSGEEITRLDTAFGGVSQFSFTPDSKYVATVGKKAQVWELVTGQEVKRFKADDEVHAVAFSPDGQYLATGSDDKTAQVWPWSRSNLLDETYGILFSPDGKYIARIEQDNTATIWEKASEQKVLTIKDTQSMGFSKDGYFITDQTDNTVKIFDISRQKLILQMPHEEDIWYSELSPNSKYLAIRESETLKVWHLKTGKKVFEQEEIENLDFSPDGKYLATIENTGREIKIWELLNGKEIRESRKIYYDFDRFFPSEYGSTLIKFSADGQQLLSGFTNGGEAIVWTVKNGKKVNHFRHDDAIQDATFISNSNYLATTGMDNTARIWDISTGKEIFRLPHDEREVWTVESSPDGKYIATAGQDYTARVWEVATGQEIVRLQHNSPVFTADFSPDGRYLTTFSTDDIMRVWLLGSENLITEACSRLERNLLLEEWQQYFPNESYQKTCPNLPGIRK